MSGNTPLTKIKILESILAITTGLVVIGLIFKIKVLFTIAAVVGICGLILPPVARIIAFLWMKLAMILGYINSRILLSIVFYLFLFPIAMIARLFNKDILQLKPKKSGSYFSDRDHEYQSEDFKYPW